MTPEERDDLAHVEEIREILRQFPEPILTRAARWGRLPACGCVSAWDHTCGKRNTPAPDHRDGWTPSPGGRGACGWECGHRWAGEGNDPDALRWPCRCSGREAG